MKDRDLLVAVARKVHQEEGAHPEIFQSDTSWPAHSHYIILVLVFLLATAQTHRACLSHYQLSIANLISLRRESHQGVLDTCVLGHGANLFGFARSNAKQATYGFD